MGANEQQILIDYLNTGKGVYIEGSDFGADHHGTDFFDYFGCAMDSDVTANIGTMNGIPSTITAGMSFGFTTHEDANMSVDAISATTGIDIFTSTGGFNRAVINNEIGFTICSTPVLGGLINGANTRAELLNTYLNFMVADPNAPALPTDFVAVPDPSGALSCDLSWVNPSTDFSGQPLTQLDEMRLYRNSVLIYTDANPTIGGTGNYSDFPAESGLYNYMIVGYNTFGEGPGANSSTWVGEDVPNVVTDLVLEDVDGQAHITWTNPTTGFNGGVFNNPIEGYTIERNDGEVFDIIDLATEFTDAVPTSGYYQYTVTPYNAIGDGGSATTIMAIIGAGTVIFSDDFEAGLGNWTVEQNGQPGLWMIYTHGSFPNSYTLPATSIGNIAGADSDEIYPIDAELILNSSLDLSSFSSVNIQFDNDWLPINSNDYAYVDISIDGGANWENVLTFDGIAVRETHEIIDITALAAGQSDVKIRFYSVQPGWDWWWVIDNVGVYGIDETSSEHGEIIPYLTKLNGNYPNPFNPDTNIKFSLHKDQKVTINIYNIKGQKVKTLVNDILPGGQHSIVWSGNDNSGKTVSSGVYFYKMKAGKYVNTKKMILMK